MVARSVSILCCAAHNPNYERVVEIDVSRLAPQVACPPDVNNVVSVGQVEDVQIDQVFLGTCTNGRLDDLAIAANILRGKTIHPNIRMVVIPASREVYLEAMRLGYLEIFAEAGASVGTPGCGPCIGRHFGVLAPGERALTTMNRNFTGRMGDPNRRNISWQPRNRCRNRADRTHHRSPRIPVGAAFTTPAFTTPR